MKLIGILNIVAAIIELAADLVDAVDGKDAPATGEELAAAKAKLRNAGERLAAGNQMIDREAAERLKD